METQTSSSPTCWRNSSTTSPNISSLENCKLPHFPNPMTKKLRKTNFAADLNSATILKQATDKLPYIADFKKILQKRPNYEITREAEGCAYICNMWLRWQEELPNA